MKILAQFLLFLSCISYANVDNRFMAAQMAMTKKICCQKPNNFKPICPKCPRGHRGHRGRTGATGATGPAGIGNPSEELFINAPMMVDEVGETPDTIFTNTYGLQTTIDAWRMSPDGDGSPANVIGAQFIIPSTLDTTQPVTLTIHYFADDSTEADGNVQFQVRTDYKTNNEQLGIVAPATDYAETLLSSETVISPATGTNLRYFTISVPLNPALMAGKTWGFIAVNRNTPADPVYLSAIYLTAYSIQYTKASV